jgi:DNA-directed RNA polymerase subunit M/transcription elongation factor TFIIS
MGDSRPPPEEHFPAKEGETEQPPKRACPKCGGVNSTFRSRKHIEPMAEKGPEFETKFRRDDCGHEWKDRAPGASQKRPLPE